MNAQLLEQKIKDSGHTKNDICSALGISRTAFYRKCNGISEFTLGEIKGIMGILGISKPDEIFFNDKVS